jgi:hypothetical protein
MRIRTYRPGDIPDLLSIQKTLALFDGLETMHAEELGSLLTAALARNGYNIFLITDDDDDLNTWGQGESLDGVEGEMVGYTILQMSRDERAYSFRCHGGVLPVHRHTGAGYALLLCAMNHARLQSLDILAYARQHAIPLYFEALLPTHDASSPRLGSIFEMERTDEAVGPGLDLYRTEM